MKLVQSRFVCIEVWLFRKSQPNRARSFRKNEGPRKMRSGSAATWTCQPKQSVNVYIPVQSMPYNHIRISSLLQYKLKQA